MKIGIDARFLTHPQVGGFKSYTENLIRSLAEIDIDNEYILYLDRQPDESTFLPAGSNFITRVVPGSLPVVGMPWREQVSLSRHTRRDALDLLHSPCLTAPLRINCPLLVTIFDIIWLHPRKFSSDRPRSPKRKIMEFYYHSIPQHAAQKASAIITVSQNAKESIVHHLSVPVNKITVTHLAASSIFRSLEEDKYRKAVQQEFGLDCNFTLALGSADPRKNTSTLVQAYALLPTNIKEKHKLAIVWTHTLLSEDIRDQVSQLDLDGNVIFLRNISSADLVYLYNAASLFVLPSRYEGFGLPPLEAMACGTPVITADNSSIPEITGDAALLVDADDKQTMANLINRVLSDDVLKHEMIQKGYKQASRFSWAKCASETAALYRQVYEV